MIVSGPLRVHRSTAEEDLVKMKERATEEGLLGVQKLQPELFRIREKRA